VIGIAMGDKNEVRLLKRRNTWLLIEVKLPTEPRMKVYLRLRKPRINKHMKPIEMEHPRTICIELGELHSAKIKKASQCEALNVEKMGFEPTTS
jgi:hypothetical protein